MFVPTYLIIYKINLSFIYLLGMLNIDTLLVHSLLRDVHVAVSEEQTHDSVLKGTT